MSVTLLLKTMLAGETVERELLAACSAPYRMTLDELEDADRGKRKVWRIVFQTQMDCERFRAALRTLARSSHAGAPGGKGHTPPFSR